MNKTLINDWWMSTDTLMGSTNTSNVTSEMIHNATKVMAYFRNDGWTDNAIAGMMGNMHLESTFSPALIQATNRWRLPNSAASLSDVPNSVMIDFYKEHYNDPNRGYGIGLVQWDGRTDTPPPGQKLVSFSERYNLNWYDGDTQCFRLKRERETNIQWTPMTIMNVYWTWEEYVHSEYDASDLGAIWCQCYEIADVGTILTRMANATFWYDYFHGQYLGVPPWLYFKFNNRRVLQNAKRKFFF